MTADLEDRLRQAFAHRANLTEVTIPSPASMARVGSRSITHGSSGLVVQMTRRRLLRASMLLAAAACLIGLILVTQGHEPRPASPPSPPSWSTVSDPSGVFQASREGAVAEGVGGGPNSIGLAAVASTAHGLVAVGSEHIGFADAAAVWLSPGGGSWSRVPHDATVFGELGGRLTSEDSGGYTMNDIVELSGTLIAVGGRFETHILQPGEQGYPGSTGTSQPFVWTSVDGTTWSRQALEVPRGVSSTITAAAAGTGGVLAIGSINQMDEGNSVITEVWYSPDGVTWTTGRFPAASGPVFGGLSANAVVAFGDQFVVVGSDNGHATAWVTRDGRTWTTAALPDGISDASQVSWARSVATTKGRVIALGTVQSTNLTGVGYSSDTGVIAAVGNSDLAVWYSDDGTTWTHPALDGLADNQLQSAGLLADGPHGDVGLVQLLVGDRYQQATIASTDGEQWSIEPNALGAPRNDLVAMPSGWVAVGSETDFFIPGPANVDLFKTPANASVWIAH